MEQVNQALFDQMAESRKAKIAAAKSASKKSTQNYIIERENRVSKAHLL